MTITHTNRKQQTYYLHQGTTKTGKPKYFFAQDQDGELVDTIPEGFEIYENPNAQVFLRRIQKQVIADAELKIVNDGMENLCELSDYIVDVKKKVITIHTPDQDEDVLIGSLDMFSTSRQQKSDAVRRHLIPATAS